MFKKTAVFLSFLFLTPSTFAQQSTDPLIDQFKETYTHIAYLNYQKSLKFSTIMQQAVENFLDNPADDSLNALQQSWIKSRSIYNQTRGLWDDQGLKDRLNPWPIKTSLIGFHGIEFLLWDKDENPNGPGQRQASDFLPQGEENQQRRLDLKKATQDVINDLSLAIAEWDPEKGSNALKLKGLTPEESLNVTVNALVKELESVSAQILNALSTSNPNDEESAFSDNTREDYKMVLKGIENIYLGRFESYQGTGLKSLVDETNVQLGQTLEHQMERSKSLAEGIDGAIDQLIMSPAPAPERKGLEALAKSLQEEADLFKEILKK